MTPEEAEALDITPEELVLLKRALVITPSMHRVQTWGDGLLYSAHLDAVVGILVEYEADGTQLAAGELHDVVEHTQLTLDMVRATSAMSDLSAHSSSESPNSLLCSWSRLLQSADAEKRRQLTSRLESRVPGRVIQTPAPGSRPPVQAGPDGGSRRGTSGSKDGRFRSLVPGQSV